METQCIDDTGFSYKLKRIWSKSCELISLDKRSLALFRILIALSTLWDLADRARDLKAHYTDEGVLPRYLVLSHFTNNNWVSIYLMAGTWWGVAALFMLNALVVCTLLVGYRTRIASILTWFFVISLQDRNYVLGHGGDVLHRSVLFFGMFLPLSDCFSIDAVLQRASSKPSENNTKENTLRKTYTVCSIASLAFIIQVMVMYISAHKLKTGKEWTEYRTSTWLALQLDFFRRPIGDFLMLFPGLCKLATFFVLEWQGIGPFLYVSPIWTGPLKMFSVFGFFTMHFVFFVSLRLGLFGWVTCSAILALTPSWFWDTIVFTKRMKTKERLGFKLFYLENCPTCKKATSFLRTFFLLSETKMLSLASLCAIGEEVPCQCGKHCNWAEEKNFVIDVKSNQTAHQVLGRYWLIVQDSNGQVYRNLSALNAICKVSPILWPIEKVISRFRTRSVNKIFNKFMEIMHSHASDSAEEKEDASQIPSKKMFYAPDSNDELWSAIEETKKIFVVILRNIIVAWFLFLVTTWNMGNLGYSYSTPNSLRWMMWVTHLDQSWSMFAPRPPSSWWYYNIDGELDDGTNIELFDKGALFTWEANEQTWKKPESMLEPFKNHRWFKYYENGINTHPQNEQLRLNFGRYICREYNSRHHDRERLYKFSIWWLSETDPKMDGNRVPDGKSNLWNHVCYDKK